MAPKSSTSRQRKAYLRLHETFTRVQKHNRYVSQESLLESHLFVELDAQPGISMKELAENLGVHQSVISRAVARLQTRGFACIRVDQQDRRTRQIGLTAKGRKEMERIDEYANARLESYAAQLSSAERRELVRFWEQLSDGLGQPVLPTRPADNMFRREQRRWTRGLGLFKKRFFGSELGSAQWHILNEVQQRVLPPNLLDLAQELSLAHNSVSRLVSVLEQKGLLGRVADAADRRARRLVLTAKGKLLMSRVETHSIAVYERALHDLSPAQIERFARLMEQFQPPKERPSAPALDCRTIHDGRGRREAREFLITQLAALRWAAHAPAMLCDDDALVVLARRKDGTIAAVCQLHSSAEGLAITCGAYLLNLDPTEQAQFILEVRRHAEHAAPGRSLVCHFLPLATLTKSVVA